MTWTGAFPFPGNPTWQLEHSASICNKMTSGWYVGVWCEATQRFTRINTSGVCGEDGGILADLFLVSFPQKATGAAGGAVPRRRNGKVFLGNVC